MITAILSLVLSTGTPSGYSVRADGVDSATKIDPQRNRTLVLTDDGGRIAGIERLPPTPASYAQFSPRFFRVGLFLGGGESSSKASHAMLLGRTRTYAGLEVNIQKGLIGALIALEDRTAEANTGDIRSKYAATGQRLGLNATLVPLPQGTWFQARWHLDLAAGAVRAHHRLQLSDGVVTRSSDALSYGPFASATLRFGIIGNVWFAARYQASREPLHFKALDLSIDDFQQLGTFGVQYAF